MKKTTLLSFGTAVIGAAIISFVTYGCGDDDVAATPKTDGGASSSGGSSGGSSGSSGNDGSTTPTKPTLGAQIDRMGRPGVNTAVQQTFTANTPREAAQDSYNKDGDKAGWVAKYKAGFAGSLAIYDGVDRTCGNQAFASADSTKQNSAVDRYGTLAGVLADDRLYVDTSQATCNQYLGVELKATSVITTADCGGRTLKYDVIDTTYTAVASTLAAPVGDDIAADATKTGGTTFPYLAAPQ